MSGEVHDPEGVTAEFYRRHRAVSVNQWDAPYGGETPLVIKMENDDYVWDPSGKSCIDWNGGILCTILNPRDPDILAAIKDQINTGVFHTSSVALNEASLRFKETASKALERWGDFVILPASSGTIADSMAIRIALFNIAQREGTDRSVRYVIPLCGYSGADFRGNAMCGLDPWKGKSTPPIEGVVFIPPFFEDLAPFDEGKQVRPEAIEAWFNENVGDAIPITLTEAGELGVGGFRRMTPEWMQQLTSATKKLGGIVICDCVQTFPGRTGKDYWGFEGWVETSEDVPDIITTAKGLGNGWPIALVAVRRDLTQNIDGKWFDTFAANPVAARVAQVVFEKTDTVEIRRNIALRADQLRHGLAGICLKYSDRVRRLVGAGLMSGLVVKPDKAEAVRAAAQKEGLWVALGADGTLRLAPHFDTTAENIDMGLESLETAIEKAA